MENVLSPPFVAELWLRNLRMLDFHRLKDWPARLTTETFKDDNVRTRTSRVRRAEWILYRLFELWDPRETQLQLAALFPALEPAQSIRLRASALAMLSGLKQDGHLGTCTLRKSLLDDCCGPRFDHLLLAFSTAVLKRIASANAAHPGFDRQYATTHDIIDNEMLQHLAWVHNATLRSYAQDKHLFRVRTEGLEAYIHIKELTLQAHDDVQQAILAKQNQDFEAAELDSKTLKKRLRLAAGPDEAWMNLLLSGEPAKDRDPMPEDSFDSLWTRTQQGRDFQKHEAFPSGFLADVESRLGQRQEQLKKWRHFQKQVSQRNEDLIVARTPAESPRKTPLASTRRSPTKSFQRKGSVKERPGSVRPSGTPLGETAAEKASGRLRDVLATEAISASSALKRSVSTRKAVQPANEHYESEMLSDIVAPSGTHGRSRSDLSSSTLPRGDPRPGTLESHGDVEQLTDGLSKLRMASHHQSLAERTTESLEMTSRQPGRRHNPTPGVADEVIAMDSIDSPLASKSNQRRSNPLAERASISLQGLDVGPKAAPKPARRNTQRTPHSKKYSQHAHLAFEGEMPSEAQHTAPPEHVAGAPDPSALTVSAGVKTPTDDLFDEGVGAESVFKTRARVRRSPPPSEG